MKPNCEQCYIICTLNLVDLPHDNAYQHWISLQRLTKIAGMKLISQKIIRTVTTKLWFCLEYYILPERERIIKKVERSN